MARNCEASITLCVPVNWVKKKIQIKQETKRNDLDLEDCLIPNSRCLKQTLNADDACG